ncbi:copper resistance CopC family protein [Peribacillus acanthi]|uniref:copper resistance CopC family protein n=1 Tax=Peribacillus acanthi TaxID=2171554 RepID=UPI000D3E24DC|nr:Ig-like domain-containing protein [Peribacillus acanthi]
MKASRFFSSIVMTFVLVFAILIPNALPAYALNGILVKSFPQNGATVVSNGAEIRLTFNADVLKVEPSLIYVYFTRSGMSVPVELETPDIVDAKTVILTPSEDLLGDKNYTIQIRPGAVTFKNGVYSYPSYTTYLGFKTNYHSFYDLFVKYESRLTGLLSTHLPREITVSAPKRYIQEINVLHKKKGKLNQASTQTSTGSVTNFDIITEEKDVSSVELRVSVKGRDIKKTNARDYIDVDGGDSDEKLFSLGLNKLPDIYDLHITVKDSEGKILDKKTLKVVSNEPITEVEQQYDYETAGNTYTLYELLSDSGTFNTLLEENEMSTLMVQEYKR